MSNQDQLVEWLSEQCKALGLSWAEASRRAGLSENTISQAASGIALGPKRLRALAEFFDVSPDFLFRKAGLLPEPPSEDELLDERLLHTLQEVAEILAYLPPDLQEKLATTIVTQAQAYRVIYETAQREAVRTEERELQHSRSSGG